MQKFKQFLGHSLLTMTLKMKSTITLYLEDVLFVSCFDGGHEDIFRVRIVDDENIVAE